MSVELDLRSETLVHYDDKKLKKLLKDGETVYIREQTISGHDMLDLTLKYRKGVYHAKYTSDDTADFQVYRDELSKFSEVKKLIHTLFATGELYA